MTIGIPGGHFFSFTSPFPLRHSRLLSVIPDFPHRHSRLDRESLSKKFKTFQKKKNFLSEKEKYLIEYCLMPISS